MNGYLQAFKWAFIGRDEFFRRKEVRKFVFFHGIVGSLVMVAIIVMNWTMFPFFLYVVAVYAPSLAIWMRRLHDAEHSK